MKKIFFILSTFLVGCTLNSQESLSSNQSDAILSISNQTESIIPTKASKVQTYPIPENVPLFTDYELFIADEKVDMYLVKVNNSQQWNINAPYRSNSGVVIFQLEGIVELKIHTPFNLTNALLSPTLYSNKVNIDKENDIGTFLITNPGQYTLELNNDRNRTIHIFVDSFTEYSHSSNEIYYGPGLYENITISPNNNQQVYIDYGAVVRGRIVAENKNNINIVGGGVIDGSTFVRDSNHHTVPFDFNYCNNIQLKGISFLDPAGWTLNWYFTNNVLIENVKIITSRSNGDGISLQSCQDVLVTKSFVRSWDDSLVVKNYPRWSNRNQQGTTKNIRFEYCIIWTDLAQSMEIGYETVGEIMDNIVFEDIIVIHNYHRAVMSIHNANNANITNVAFKNITIQDAHMGQGDGVNVLIEINTMFSGTWSTQHATTSLGSIDGVEFYNIKVDAGNIVLPINIRGCVDYREGYNNSIHPVNNVRLKNILLKKSILTSPYEYLTINEYTHNLTIENDSNIITGANPYLYYNSAEYYQ
jgi:hypothetical protein